MPLEGRYDTRNRVGTRSRSPAATASKRGSGRGEAGLVSPVRRQYLEQKARHPDAILFFRLGDFYETFDGDAELVSRELEIALTSKPLGEGLRVPLAGVPVQAVERHLARLIARGHRVAICEQLEDPKATKGLVARGVVRVLSPGTALEPALLEAGSSRYCAALAPPRRSGARAGRAGLAAVDLSTGEFLVCELGPFLSADGAAEGESVSAVPETVPETVLERAVVRELARLGAVELLLPAGAAPPAGLPASLRGALRARPPDRFDEGAAARRLCRHYAVADVEGLGLAGRPAALAAAGALLDYLAECRPSFPGSASQGSASPGSAPAGGASSGGVFQGGASPGGVSPGGSDPLAHLAPPRLYEPGASMALDAATERALGLFSSGRGDGRGGEDGAGSLLSLLDRCRTAAGRRLLRRRLARPLLELGRIEARLERVALLCAQGLLRRRLREGLAAVPDLERLLGRISAGEARPPEVAALGRGLGAAAVLRAALVAPLSEGPVAGGGPGGASEAASTGIAAGAGEAGAGEAASAGIAEAGAALRAGMAEELRPCPAAAEAIAATLVEEPAADCEEGGVVRPGCDAELDRWRAQLARGREAIAALEARERERSGIATLKLGYHRSFGYYLEVSSSKLGRVPPDWERRQTLAGGERFTTAELRQLEGEVAAAREAAAARERALFQRLCRRLAAEAAALRALARGLARLDVAAALAEVASARGYVRPQLDLGGAIEIREGRHPMVEASLPPGRFVPNDLRLRAEREQVLVVTGPNMAGKSTYLRQAALIVLLAQCGSFVPAAEARIGLVDRIFARVGAHDDLAAGQSTFMVEMLETAAILAGAGDRSLLILDEIGRGTSTYDGLAIARALLEQLASGPRRGPRTLFATHFQELTELAGGHDRIGNAHVAVEEVTVEEVAGAGEEGGGPGPGRGGVRFLFRVLPGGADRSYGIQVAEMAGLPAPLLARAREILTLLEGGLEGGREGGGAAPGPGAGGRAEPSAALLLPPPPSPLLADLAALAVEELTPLEAIGALFALRERARVERAEEPAPRPSDSLRAASVGETALRERARAQSGEGPGPRRSETAETPLREGALRERALTGAAGGGAAGDSAGGEGP